MDPDKKNSIGRYRILFGFMCLAAVYVLGTALRTMLPPKSEYWASVNKRFIKENVPIPASRGNLLGCDGQVLVGTLPKYRLCVDFRVGGRDSVAVDSMQRWRDDAYKLYKDSIALGLARIFPEYGANWFRNRIEKGLRERRFGFQLYPKLASYIQYKQAQELPVLRESVLKGGFHGDPIPLRIKPYGSLASRTLGELYTDSGRAKCGLELSFDSILRGTPGSSHRIKVRDARVSIIDRPPLDGHDLKTTIDINLQDVAERSLKNKLMEESVNGEVGIAIVMEVKTGDVKAIVNLTRGADGNYYEMKNNAVSDLMEPGSTFKTASIMVALEDGKITKDTRVDTGKGVYKMHGSNMKDHNWNKGGYGELTVSQVLEFSSNIGVSRLIDDAYHDHPEAYVDGLYREGVGIPLNLPFAGAGEPKVRRPEKKGKYWLNWSKTALPWMSIGYETMLPPISTLTFYNAIANGGCMVKPRFITAELCDGQVVREFPTEVIKPSICSKHTLYDIQDILEKVVSQGLGKKAGNGGKLFKVSGKTGTAQIASGGSYRNGVHRYMVSFCGYFPSEAPRYSCIVCIVKRGTPASGGSQAGPVFRDISLYLMSKGVYRNTEEAADSNSVYTPEVLKGSAEKTETLLKQMNLRGAQFENDPDTLAKGRVPNFIGMGASDAVYEAQKRGLKVRITGVGRVMAQDISAGSEVTKGKTITLTLK